MAKKGVTKIAATSFVRDRDAERRYGIDDLRLYAYWEGESGLTIVGQIMSSRLKGKCCIQCALYDEDGDILEATENDSYGSGLVTSMIYPKTFFNGFPFKFSFYGVKEKRVKQIRLFPSDSY